MSLIFFWVETKHPLSRGSKSLQTAGLSPTIICIVRSQGIDFDVIPRCDGAFPMYSYYSAMSSCSTTTTRIYQDKNDLKKVTKYFLLDM
jgi:hypothetical protein